MIVDGLSSTGDRFFVLTKRSSSSTHNRRGLLNIPAKKSPYGNTRLEDSFDKILR